MDTEVDVNESIKVFNTIRIVKAFSKTIDDTPIELRYSLAKPKTTGHLPTIYFKDTPSFRAQQRGFILADRIAYRQPGSYAHVLSVSVALFPPSFANLMCCISRDIDTLDASGKLKGLLEKRKVVSKFVIPKHLGTIDYPQMRIDRFGINVIFFSKTIYSLSREKITALIRDKKDTSACDRLSEIVDFLNRCATKKHLRPEINRITLQEASIAKTSFVLRACSELDTCADMAIFPFLHCDGDLIFAFEAETSQPSAEASNEESDMFQVTSRLDQAKLESIEEQFKDLISKDDRLVFTKSVLQKTPEYKDASTSLLEDLTFT